MTAQFNEEKYQSDRLTFERQQFEEAYWSSKSFKHLDRDWVLRKNSKEEYRNVEEINYLWEGWKLAKGIK